MYGKVENNFHLSNKKALFANMKLYYEALNQDPFEVLPLTFHIKNGITDPEFLDFKKTFTEFSKNPAFKNVWIVKPGENTNRGYGIQVVSSLTEV
jgi:tubulin--tyrosine ligase